MNALLLLMGLLVLSYIGSFLVGGRALRGFGLPSGIEYVALGFAVGPTALGLVDRTMLEAFEPLTHVALGWLALILGLDYAFLGRRRVRLSSFVAANLAALLTGSAIALAEYLLLDHFHALHGTDLLLVAGGIGTACSETTRHAVRWVVERHKAEGPLSDLLAEIAECDDLLPLVATALLFALAPASPTRFVIPEMAWGGVTVGLGILMAVIASVLLGREFRLNESWGVLLGTSLLGVGLSARLNLSPLSVMFCMGIAVSLISRHREELAVMVGPTERPVLLPALLLAGARIDPPAAGILPLVVGTAVAARIGAKTLAGLFFYAGSRTARRAGPGIGLGFLSSGQLAMTIGLSFALRFPGMVGNTVLATVVGVTLVGELVGPASLRAALTAAGEIADATPKLSTEASGT
jgi:hypothetical protein